MTEQEDIRRFTETWPKIRILILGSYSKLQFLEQMRGRLNAMGFKNVKLVKDFNYPPMRPNETKETYFYNKSLYWLNKADGYIWVFFGRGYDESTIVEFSSFQSNDILGKMSRSLIILPEGIDLSTLLQGRIDLYTKYLTVQEITDEDLNEAVESAEAFIVNLIEMLFPYLEIRAVEEKWEIYSKT